MVPTLDRVELKPVNIDGSASEEDISSYVAIWNKSRNQIENIVPRNNSAVIQHKDAFGAFARVVREKGLNVKGTIKNFGGHVIVEALFGGLKVDDGSKNGVEIGVRLENNYERRGPSFNGTGFGLRGVCSNGMVLRGEVSRITKKHTKIAEIEKGLLEFVQSVIDSQENIAETIENAKKDKFDSFADARKVLIGEIASRNVREKVAEYFESRDSITRYTIYNALTQYATHDASNEASRMRLQRVAQRILIKPKSELKRGREVERASR